MMMNRKRWTSVQESYVEEGRIRWRGEPNKYFSSGASRDAASVAASKLPTLYLPYLGRYPSGSSSFNADRLLHWC